MTLTINPRFKALIHALKPDEFAQLESNIISDGCRDPLVCWNGTIIDGHNRYEICTKHGKRFEVIEQSFQSEEHAVLWILLNQLGRRNLTDDQRAMMADKAAQLQSKLARSEQAKEAANIRHGNSKPCVQNTTPNTHSPKETTRATVAKKAGVSERKMQRARAVSNASPELAQKVAAGELTLVAACREIARGEASKVKPNAPDAKFRVIYSDPPWKYGDTRNGLEGTTGAEAHYPTMSISELCQVPVREWCEPNAVLFLWVTSPFLDECFSVISAWGFTYKASFVWDKIKHNMGHYNSVRHEFLLVCTRGSCVPDVPKLFDSVQSIERSDKHSEKPEDFRTIIDTIYPNGKRLEMFARVAKSGWEKWGNEL